MSRGWGQEQGLRNRELEELTLSRQELRLAHFHATLDRWLESDRGMRP